ncbi:sulfurtransferase [Photobacterium aquimaris]|uniref:Sulfurtransferase n=1 Tax=Photobacterium aquimaris TaxID=512643 RepID=A0A2T3ILN2_9GAMM|nr:rhodanese-like domain-containing protein [Photobacterium aquimaris]OBU17749.1 sulfurtransferase [Photobacterium aquimaris]OBU18337.1 sulfurtransferase [Photobacterium aquimaris]PSU29261.1 sulfurtransferase [Photobacterium aquimaris]PSV96956.1 sulfurtransferase [Photobacterium aquimaris]
MNKYRITIFSIIFLFFSGLNSTYANERQHKWVIEGSELQQKINENQPIIIFDARSQEQYQQGHISTAISFPTALTYVAINNAYYVKSIKKIAPLLQQKGVTTSQQIIIYDQGDLKNAARLFWVLELYGIKNIAILNGGINAWSEQYQLTKIATIPQSSQYFPVLNSSVYASTTVAKVAAYSDLYQLYDSRTLAEFIGERSATDKFGHIPTAKNIQNSVFFNTTITGTNLLKTPKQLDAIFATLDKNRKSVTYCNKGLASTLTYFLMKQAGFKVSHYDGSWLEWSEKGLPVEK